MWILQNALMLLKKNNFYMSIFSYKNILYVSIIEYKPLLW